MPITYDETFEIITPESAEHGDAEERGFIGEDLGCDTFAEIMDLLRGTEPSCYPLTCANHVWYTSYAHEEDYKTGEVENRSYHPIGERAQRYFMKAWHAANNK